MAVVVVIVVMVVIVIVVVVMVVVVVVIMIMNVCCTANEWLLDRCVVDRVVGMIVVIVVVSVVVTVVIMVMVVVVHFATQVVVTIAGVQDSHLDQVEEETHDGNYKHDATLDLGRHEESLSGLYDEPDSHDPDD